MKKIYTISYLSTILIILLIFVIFRDMSDSLMLLLAAFAFILTSIFTYSRRK